LKSQHNGEDKLADFGEWSRVSASGDGTTQEMAIAAGASESTIPYRGRLTGKPEVGLPEATANSA
jgi:hypothetical protein